MSSVAHFLTFYIIYSTNLDRTEQSVGQDRGGVYRERRPYSFSGKGINSGGTARLWNGEVPSMCSEGGAERLL